MNVVSKYTICVFVLFFQIIHAQYNYDNNKVMLHQISSNENQIINEKITTQVIINQIGIQNQVEFNINKDNLNSNYLVFQEGYLNKINVIKPFSNLENEEFYFQKGTNNYISKNVFFSNSSNVNSITQYGNNLSFQSYGSNAISNNIQIFQSGNFGNILMFNR